MSRGPAEAEPSPIFLAARYQRLSLRPSVVEFMLSVGTIARRNKACLRRFGKLIIAGNGGSAGDPQHLAAEFLSGF